jgi:hypothetical protein
MKNDKTDTPRTDAVFWKFHTHDDIVNLARDLERELGESERIRIVLNAENIRLRRLLEKQHDILCHHGLEEYGN